MSDFDLDELIREVSRADSTGDITLIAKEVRLRINDDDIAAALDQSLPRYVYDVARHAGRRTRAPAAAGATSSKVRAIRHAWRAQLDARIGVAPGVSKRYGDCTIGDLEWAATVRKDLARTNRDAAARLGVLVDLLRTHNVTTVRELPDDVLADHFGRRAA